MYDNSEYTVTHWDGSRMLCRNTGLRLSDAQDIAGQWSSIVGSATVDADEGDYREVWVAGYLDRKGPFAQVTLVVGGT